MEQWEYQILNDFCWLLLNFTKYQYEIIIYTQMEALQHSKLNNMLADAENISDTDQHTHKVQVQSQENTCLKSIEKQKKIMRKPDSILRRLRIEAPLSFNHVHSIFNMMGLNEQAMRDNDYEESYFKTMFYINTVERVELRKHALILQLKSTQKQLQPISYLIERYKSFGDQKFYDIAQAIQTVATKITAKNFMQKLKKSFDGEPLSRFIDSMQGQTYMCKVAPNKLVISRSLLELLGEEPESYAVEMCKYKMAMREIISAESYATIIKKSINNISSVCDFVNSVISAEDLHANTSIDFTDYLITRQNKKIYCSMILFMPTPQMSCIQVRQVLSQTEEVKLKCSQFAKKRKTIQQRCEEMRYSEAEILKNIIRVPDGLLKSNIRKLAEYRDISSLI